MKLNLTADKVLIRGPKVDGSYVISLEVGEYEKLKLMDILKLKTDEVVKVTLEQSSGNPDDI